MPGNNYLLLLNNALKDYLLGCPGKEKRRLREKLEYLESGIWDSGIRVKKLRGFVNKVVFEARLSKGDRLLFTLGRDRDGRTVIYVWGIAKHDDIGRMAELIAPDNAPFLGFEADLKDEIHLCKEAIGLLDGGGGRFLYDLVVCDEVQDFTDIQLSLIFRLSSDHRGIVLCGDPKQVINPSGFRWEEVLNLNLNFRCVGGIVTLSNALLDLKQRLIGVSSSELREEWKFRPERSSRKPPC
jgi:hypothetical protein